MADLKVDYLVGSLVANLVVLMVAQWGFLSVEYLVELMVGSLAETTVVQLAVLSVVWKAGCLVAR